MLGPEEWPQGQEPEGWRPEEQLQAEGASLRRSLPWPCLGQSTAVSLPGSYREISGLDSAAEAADQDPVAAEALEASAARESVDADTRSAAELPS